MKNLAVSIVSVIFRGIVQVLIDEIVRAERAEAQVAALTQQLQELASAQPMRAEQNGAGDISAGVTNVTTLSATGETLDSTLEGG